MALRLSILDVVAVLGYLLFLLWLGRRARRSAAASALEEFLLVGRTLSLPLFVASLVSTWYGGLIGIGEIAYRDGLVTWLTQGVFWYVSYLLFAFFLAPRLQRSKLRTLPDQIGALHGPRARLIATTLNYFNVVPIAYLLSLGLIVRAVTGWPLPLGVALGAAVAVAYSLVGGFRAVIYTDALQFGLMCTAVAALMITCVLKLGGGAYLVERVPAAHLVPLGRLSPQELLVWATIALSTLVDPNFYQRCFAAGSAATAKRGILLSVGIWLLFDVCTVFSGIYARAALPGIDPRMAFPQLAAELLPSGLRGIYFCGLLATVMSTVDSYCFVGAMTLSHDLLYRTLRPRADDRQIIRATRGGIVFTALLASVLSLVFDGSIKAIWKTLGSLSSAALLVPMLLGLAGYRAAGAGAWSIVAGAFGSLGSTAIQHWWPELNFQLDPLFVGLVLSLGAYLAAALVVSRREA